MGCVAPGEEEEESTILKTRPFKRVKRAALFLPRLDAGCYK